MEPRAVSQLSVDSSAKLTVTVMMTGTGLPFMRVGAKRHWLTAASAASSSKGTTSARGD